MPLTPKNSRTKPDSSFSRGRRGEDLACLYLQKIGHLILERNFRTAGGEVDIISMKEDVLCAIEVKAWRRDLWQDLGLSLDSAKSQRVRKALRAWIHTQDRLPAYRVISLDAMLVDPLSGMAEHFPGALEDLES